MSAPTEENAEFFRWLNSGEISAEFTRELIARDYSNHGIVIRAALMAFICGWSDGIAVGINPNCQGREWLPRKEPAADVMAP